LAAQRASLKLADAECGFLSLQVADALLDDGSGPSFDFLEYHGQIFPQDADAKKKHGSYQTKKKTYRGNAGIGADVIAENREPGEDSIDE